jgi:hypothetical protein
MLRPQTFLFPVSSREKHMKSKLLPLLSGALLVLASLATADTASEHHVLASGAAVKWGPPPPTLPPGAQLAVIDGDPAVRAW